MNWQFWQHQRPTPTGDCTDNCDEIGPLLSLMSDRMASNQETRRAEAHLGACDRCRQTLAWMEATRRVIVERPAMLPPADMRARIAQAIASSAETALPAVPTAVHPTRRAFVLRPAFAAAMSLAVAGAFWGHALLTSHPVPPPMLPAMKSKGDNHSPSRDCKSASDCDHSCPAKSFGCGTAKNDFVAAI